MFDKISGGWLSSTIQPFKNSQNFQDDQAAVKAKMKDEPLKRRG
jgi:hypothetical protein